MRWLLPILVFACWIRSMMFPRYRPHLQKPEDGAPSASLNIMEMEKFCADIVLNTCGLGFGVVLWV
jgi:hypothetical protein